MSGLKHNNRLKCHRGIVSQWTFQVGLNVTVDELWVDVMSRHRFHVSTPLGIEPRSLMTESERIDHWTSGTVYECSEIAGSPQNLR